MGKEKTKMIQNEFAKERYEKYMQIMPELIKSCINSDWEKLTVYRAGDEPLHLAKCRISWTTDLEVAKWFSDRAAAFHQSQRHLYKGTIKPEQFIWYTDDREEKEIMQYTSVSNVMEISR